MFVDWVVLDVSVLFPIRTGFLVIRALGLVYGAAGASEAAAAGASAAAAAAAAAARSSYRFY